MKNNSSDSAILTVGSMAFDSVRTPTGNANHVLGGSCNYFSIAASFFAPVRVVAVVGEDFPKEHLDWMAKKNIDVSGVEIAKGKTFHWVGEYEGDLSEAKTLSTALNVFERFEPKLSKSHRGSKYIFLANIDPVIQLDILKQAPDARLIACDSMNFWITGKPKELRETLKLVDILCLNATEAKLISGKDSPLTAAKEIFKLGPKVLVVKQGEYGASLFTRHSIFMAPAFPLEKVVDPTGAGDTFAGGFFGSLAQLGMTREMLEVDPIQADRLLREAVIAGSVMASFTVEDFSIRRLTSLKPEECKSRSDALKGMIKI